LTTAEYRKINDETTNKPEITAAEPSKTPKKQIEGVKKSGQNNKKGSKKR